jgi:hypothetical protein
MFYNPDYRYIRGQELLEKLEGVIGEDIRYYFQEKEKYHKEVSDRLYELDKALNIITRNRY